MAAWTPPSWFLPTLAGGIVGFILSIGFIGGIVRYMKCRRVEKDLEANQAMPESKASTAPAEIAQAAAPSMGSDEIRRTVETDSNFVDVDLRDPMDSGEYIETEGGIEVERKVSNKI